MKLCKLLKELSRYTDTVQTEKYGERRNYSFAMIVLSSIMFINLALAFISYALTVIIKFLDGDMIAFLTIATVNMLLFTIVFLIRCLLWFKRDVGDIKYFPIYTEGAMVGLTLIVIVLILIIACGAPILVLPKNIYTVFFKSILPYVFMIVPIIIFWFFTLAFINIVHFEIKDYKRKKESE